MADKKAQLALDLRHRAAMGREDFLVAPSNAEAVAWIDRWPDWPAPALVLVGPPGCGKTHLGHVWLQAAGAIAYEYGQDQAMAASLPPVFVDGTDDPSRDEELFHLFNTVSSSGGSLLLATDTPPGQWENRLPDLRSRLAAAPNIRIHPPDETLISALLVKMFADQHMDVSAEVLSYLINRMERSFEAASVLVERLNNASLAAKRGITIPLAREVFEDLADGPQEI